MSAESDNQQSVVVITPDYHQRQYLRACWRFRELMFFLARRDLVVRYRQTLVGMLWLLARPALTVLVLSVVFGKLAKLPSGQVPYAVLVLGGVLPWQFFHSIVSQSTISLIGNVSLVTKAYVPRAILPLSTILPNLLDLGITLVVAIVVLALTADLPPARIVLLPLALLPITAFAAGCGLWLSALAVRFRDVASILPFALQIGMLISPVGFASALIPEAWRFWFYLNPLAIGIDLTRWCIDATTALPALGYGALSCGVALAVLTSGFAFFRRCERRFADVI